jgi:hypothetical protein
MEQTNLKNVAIAAERIIAAFAETPARLAFFSPRRFPMLRFQLDPDCHFRKIGTNRTEVATPRANGA